MTRPLHLLRLARRALILAAAGVLAVCAACRTVVTTPQEVTEAGSPVGAACTESIGCGVDELCAFAIADGCQAQGVCVQQADECTEGGPIVCACDGDPVELSCLYGAGYAPLPVLGTTPGCTITLDGGAD
jgi:hypothetical protein